jgi:hypothetical protein
MRHAHPLLALLLAACAPVDLGPVDRDAAYELVYAPDGAPAYAGQALMIESCGGGGFCHAGGDVRPEDRFGTPAHLDFDLRPLMDAPRDRLFEAGADTFEHRRAIWTQVEAGLMPPGGAVGERVLMDSRVGYQRVEEGGGLTALPGLDTEEGRDILRNWLGCGVPLVERIEGASTGLGQVVPGCQLDCVDATWPSLYVEVIEPGCTQGACHDAEDPRAGLDLSSAGTSPAELAAVLARLGTPAAPVAARGALCASTRLPLLDVDGAPGAIDARDSLLYLKVADAEPVCGSAMPLTGNRVASQRLCALELWLTCGACADPADARCQSCVDEGLADCGIDRSTRNRCDASVACPPRVEGVPCTD